jgi:hypothetical protein
MKQQRQKDLHHKKHICPNRVDKSSVTNANISSATRVGVSAIKPTYYNKKAWTAQPKPKKSNFFELLTGPIETIQHKYETLSDLVTEHNGKIHGSQQNKDPKTGLIDLL